MGGEGNDAKIPEDVVVLQGPTEDGGGIRVIRAREARDGGEKVEIGEVRPLRDGQSVTGEVVSLHPRAAGEQGGPRVCDVKVLYDSRARSGPAQVATNAYRESWDAIFGAPNESNRDRPN